MAYEIERETHIHGKSWAKQGGGFFADPDMARDYVDAIMRTARTARPDVIVDLGGGTGFILEQLAQNSLPESIRLINLDESEKQLAECGHPRIRTMKGVLQSFSRDQVAGPEESILLICRSVLHYGGIFRQRSWLAHVRSQMRAGEWFVHQSGCAENLVGSLALGVLFEQMGVDKWVSYHEKLLDLLKEAGLETRECFQVPPLRMVSDEMARRYGLSREKTGQMAEDLRQTGVEALHLATFMPDGFMIHFPYRVFVCQAV